MVHLTRHRRRRRTHGDARLIGLLIVARHTVAIRYWAWCVGWELLRTLHRRWHRVPRLLAIGVMTRRNTRLRMLRLEMWGRKRLLTGRRRIGPHVGVSVRGLLWRIRWRGVHCFRTSGCDRIGVLGGRWVMVLGIVVLTHVLLASRGRLIRRVDVLSHVPGRWRRLNVAKLSLLIWRTRRRLVERGICKRRRRCS